MTDVNEQIPSYSFSFLHAFFFSWSWVMLLLFLLFFSRLFFLFFLGLRCSSSFFGGGHFPFSFWGRRICSSCFWSLFLVSYFLGPFLSLSLDRLNKPLGNRFLLVLSRFSDRLRGTMVTQSKTHIMNDMPKFWHQICLCCVAIYTNMAMCEIDM